MKTLGTLIKRNTKLFFKDKGIFFTSLITPLILLVLYATFLGNVYRDSFVMSLPEGMQFPEKLLGGCVGGQLISSILAVSCITVAFCSNMLMVQDKVNGSIKDLTISPVKPSTLALSYYFATLISTLIVCLTATVVCLIYVASVGWFMTVSDILLLLIDVFLLVMFGTALSSVICFFLSSQGQISAVGSIVSSCYGFICGAYMPISQFGDGLQTVISFLPGTYGTALVRNHAMNGVFREMERIHFPKDAIESIKDGIDCNLYFFGDKVSISAMYAILGGTVALLILAYILLNKFKKKMR
ncbi:MAG: ABC transporter permease [Ruminococcaceae bacterium]|nr:ABC transporter permease [Oscillospiraceae bacterium]